MSEKTQAGCSRCGATLQADDAFCPACLLGVAVGEAGGELEERIFQQALALEPEAREAFIREATRDNPKLHSSVLLLMEGYEEAGGDGARPTQGDADNCRSQWAAVESEEPGTVISHFRLIRKLGEGGMGSVWLAEQSGAVRRNVALKVIKLGMDTREVVRRFQRERQTLALLNHPNIAQVYEAGATTLGRPYFAMELAEGQPITVYCAKAGLDVNARLRLMQEVCAAVQHAHQKGVIHRDLKPSNILVAGGAVKIIDFGVAKATQGTGDNFLTQETRIVGTPAYMSPEQARTGGVDVDTRTDVYALGVVLYELLTGTLPIESTRLSKTPLPEMQRIIMEEDPPTPSTRMLKLARRGELKLNASQKSRPLPRDLDMVVMKAIRKNREERYSSAAALGEDLRRYLAGEPVTAAPLTAAYQVGKFVRRNRVVVTAAAMILVTLVAGLIVSLVQMRRATLALAGQAKARREATLTLADMYAQSGLTAAENRQPTRAALWFASAAIVGAEDSERVEVNSLRATAWSSTAATPVRAILTPYEHLHDISWNPRNPAIILQAENVFAAQIWDLKTEKLWPPAQAMRICRAAWSRSGDRVAIYGADGTVSVLEFPSGKAVAQIKDVALSCLEWSLDDRWIVAGDSLWDWETGARKGLPANAVRVLFEHNGKYVLLQWTELAGVFTMDDPGKFLYSPVPAHSGGKAEFIGDGSRYAVGLPNGGLEIRDAGTGAILNTFTNGVTADFVGLPLSVSADGRFLARQNMSALDFANNGGEIALATPDRVAASFSPDGLYLAAGGYDSRLTLWSVPEGKPLGDVGHHHNGVVNVAFSPDSRFVASGEDGLVRVWRLAAAEPVKKIPVGKPTLAVITPDGKRLAASGFSNAAGDVRKTRLYDTATGAPAGPEIDPNGLLVDAVFSTDGGRMVLAVSTSADRSRDALNKTGGTGNIQIWNPVSGERIGEPIVMPSEPRGVSFDPTGRIIGVYCASGEGVEVDASSGKTNLLFNHHFPWSAGATLNNGQCGYSADGRYFLAWGLFQHIHLWDRQESREIIDPFERETTTFDVACHGDIVARAIVAPSMRIQFRDLKTGGEAAPSIPYVNWPFLTRFSSDGNLLLTAGGCKSAQVWDWRHGKLACPMLPHDETVMAACFVPGTPWVATGGHDGKIKFWDSRTGMMIRPPIECGGWVLKLDVTPDAKMLVASGVLDGSIHLINLHNALAVPDLPPAGTRLFSEVDADAEVLSTGGLAALTPQAWIKKWREFREHYPDYQADQLDW